MLTTCACPLFNEHITLLRQNIIVCAFNWIVAGEFFFQPKAFRSNCIFFRFSFLFLFICEKIGPFLSFSRSFIPSLHISFSLVCTLFSILSLFFLCRFLSSFLTFFVPFFPMLFISHSCLFPLLLPNYSICLYFIIGSYFISGYCGFYYISFSVAIFFCGRLSSANCRFLIKLRFVKKVHSLSTM